MRFFVFTASPMQNSKRNGRLRIVNGEQIEIQVVPSQVSIIELFESEGEKFGYHSCGGTILSKNLVLTAGHCVDLEPKDYLIRSGSTSWFEGGSLHKVVKIIRHEDYLTDSIGRIHDDIAIMKVEPEFEVDGVTEKFTKLADEDDKVKHADDAYVSGWGELEICFTIEVIIRVGNILTVKAPIFLSSNRIDRRRQYPG